MALLISVFLIGLLASLDPLRPALFVLVLRTDRARVNAIAFFVGWALSLVVLFALAFVAFGGAGESGRANSAQRLWVSVLELLLGAVMWVLAGRRWRRRNAPDAHHSTPAALLRRLEGLTPRGAGIMGVLIQPRTLTFAAALIVARDHSGLLSYATGLSVFALVSTGVLLGIFIYYIRRPQSARSKLSALLARVEGAGPTLTAVLFGLAGTVLLGYGLRGLINR